MRTLKRFVIERRGQLGLNQTELAKRAGVPRTTVNRIESGTTKLPEADVRRKIAQALGVRHLDLLVAAGEISEEEAGLQADIRTAPVRRLQPMIDQIQWDDSFYRHIEAQLRFLRDVQQGHLPVAEMSGKADSQEE